MLETEHLRSPIANCFLDSSCRFIPKFFSSLKRHGVSQLHASPGSPNR